MMGVKISICVRMKISQFFYFAWKNLENLGKLKGVKVKRKIHYFAGNQPICGFSEKVLASRNSIFDEC